MKIGILTFHRALNYGAVLQCYALYTTLKDMGHDVEIIDYRPEAIEKYRMLFRWRDFSKANGLIQKMRYIASSLALVFSKRKTAKHFDQFINNNLSFSKIVKSTEDMPEYYDCIFFGSDQIWNPEICEGLDKMFYGQFKKGETKFIGYAASLGRQELTNGELAETFRNYLNAYDQIAVREQSLQKFLADEFNIDSTMVCDPSLLMSKETCESIAIEPKDKNYVLVFNLDSNPEAVPFARRIGKQIGAEVIEMRAEANHLHRFPCKTRTELSPGEFLGYIKHARCVVTNSFHATSFSIIMQKDFYTIKRKSNNDRSRTILSITGLEDRMVDAKEDITFSSITNYEECQENIKKYTEHSLEFIRKQL